MVIFTIWKHEHQGEQNVAVVSLSSLTHKLILLRTDSLWVSTTQLEYKNTLQEIPIPGPVPLQEKLYTATFRSQRGSQSYIYYYFYGI